MVNLDPNNKEFQIKAYSSMNTMYISMGEYGKAVECNNKILAIDPNNATAKSNNQYIQSIQTSSARPKANPNEISGVIKDSSGSPIVSASVRVKILLQKLGQMPRVSIGLRCLKLPTTLVISAKGYATKEVAVTKSRVYNATLSK